MLARSRPFPSTLLVIAGLLLPGIFLTGCGQLDPVSRSPETEERLPEITGERGEPVRSSERKTSGVRFEQEDLLQPALEKAETTGKLIFLDFYTDWCLPCKIMDENVFPDSVLGAFMNEEFINLKINAEYGNGANLAFLYQVKEFPTLLFLDEKGRELMRREGGLSASPFFEMARAVVQKKQESPDNEED